MHLLLGAFVALEGGPSYKSLHSYSGSQPSLTPVPGDLIPYLTSVGTRHAHGVRTYM